MSVSSPYYVRFGSYKNSSGSQVNVQVCSYSKDLIFPLPDLEIAEKVAEIDVEELPVLLDHDVVRMPVTDSQHVRGHAVAGTRTTESFCSCM